MYAERWEKTKISILLNWSHNSETAIKRGLKILTANVYNANIKKILWFDFMIWSAKKSARQKDLISAVIKQL